MKLLFFPSCAVLTIVLLTLAASADQYIILSDVPMSEVVTLREMPSCSISGSVVTAVSDMVYAGEQFAIPMPYAAEKPPEKPIALPEPLVLTPFLPIQNLPSIAEVEEEARAIVIRGQLGMEGLAGILETPPPLARGPVDADTIDPKLIESPAATDSEFDIFGVAIPNNADQKTPSGRSSGAQSADPLGYGVLVFATIVATLGLIYMAFVAFDYRQRWMQSLMMQNDRYIGGEAFDIDTGDMYGGGSVSFSDSLGLSESFGLVRRSSI